MPTFHRLSRMRREALAAMQTPVRASLRHAAPEEPWELKDLRKTRATYYDEHVPESSVEILSHSVGGITYRRYAHRAPLAFRAIMTLPQPSGFSAILRAGDSEWPCCQSSRSLDPRRRRVPRRRDGRASQRPNGPGSSSGQALGRTSLLVGYGA